MAIVTHLDEILRQRGMTAKELCQKVGIRRQISPFFAAEKQKVSAFTPSIEFAIICSVM